MYLRYFWCIMLMQHQTLLQTAAFKVNIDQACIVRLIDKSLLTLDLRRHSYIKATSSIKSISNSFNLSRRDLRYIIVPADISLGTLGYLGYLPQDRIIKMISWKFIDMFNCFRDNFAVIRDPNMFEHVPNELKTSEMCSLAVRWDPVMLIYTPNNFKTSEMWNFAVRGDPLMLIHTPDKFKMCSLAVRKNSVMLEFVPDEFKIPETCSLVVKENPDKLKTSEMCSFTVRQARLMLIYTPDKLKAPEMCSPAVRENPVSLISVPDKLKTREMCSDAFRENNNMIKYIRTGLLQTKWLKSVRKLLKQEFKLKQRSNVNPGRRKSKKSFYLQHDIQIVS